MKGKGFDGIETTAFVLWETKRWKRDVLEAYLGVTLKRNFATGPEAFQEILARLEHFTRSLNQQDESSGEEKIPDAVIETLTSLAVAIDGKSHYTQGHSQKVSAYAVRVARALNLSENEIEELRLAGLLHDVGKVGILESILIKAGPLDPSEWETMKTHTSMGARLLEPLGHLGRIQAIILHHHEFFDGSGYPAGLAGSAIPLGARIIGIADAFDTITSDRVYKKARPASDALAELERCSGTQFDPELVKLFVAAARQYPNPVIELNELDSELAPGPVHS